MSQNTLKALALGAVLGFTFSIVPSCGTPTPTTCGSANCSTGCCNNGKCVTGTNTNNTTCGTAGNSCSDCTKTAGSSCDKSTFKCTGGNTGGGAGGGTGGGATGGGTGGGATGGGSGGGSGGGMANCQATCAGCCDATGVCKTSGNTTCGVNGATCAACASPATCNAGTCKDTTCATCSKNGVCQTAAMLGNTTCGNGGITCIDCTTTAGATCNTTTGMCTGGTCAGCRDATSACVAGNTKGACGLGGGTCTACTGTQVCSNGACVAGTGGGAGGGGGTGGTGGNGTCPGGAPCTNGCCSGTQCIATTFQSQTNCGFNGATCASCASNQTCNTGVCTGGAGGGAGGGAAGGGTGGTGGSATGGLGAVCNLDTDCGGVAITTQEATAGFKAFCKKNLNPEGSPYPGGYCTRRCIPGSAPCPAGGFCDYIDAPYGEYDNICLAPCTGSGQGTCRAGYGCFPYGATNFCYPLYADGGSDSFPPGPGNAGNPAAGACTTSAMCAPTVAVYPSTFPAGFCAPQTLPDGGNSGFPQGMCRTECGAALSLPAASGGADAWCGTNGACNGYILGNSNTGPVIGWLCDQECTFADAGVRSTCRTGYACDDVANGKCIPRCDQPGNSCAAPTPNCNTTTGLCGP